MQLVAGCVSPYRLSCCRSYDPIILSRLVVGVSAGIGSFALSQRIRVVRYFVVSRNFSLPHLLLTKTNAYYCNRCIKKASSFWKVKILMTPKIGGIIVGQAFYFPSLRTPGSTWSTLLRFFLRHYGNDVGQRGSDSTGVIGLERCSPV